MKRRIESSACFFHDPIVFASKTFSWTFVCKWRMACPRGSPTFFIEPQNNITSHFRFPLPTQTIIVIVNHFELILSLSHFFVTLIKIAIVPFAPCIFFPWRKKEERIKIFYKLLCFNTFISHLVYSSSWIRWDE